MGMLIVTHDLGVAAEVSDRVAVMYAGRFVEEGLIGPFMAAPLHPYAHGLIGATVHGGSRGKPLATIPGAPPNLRQVPSACAFAPRCPRAEERCLAGVPQLLPVSADAPGTGPDRTVRCLVVQAETTPAGA